MAELTAQQAVAHHDRHDETAQNENRKFGMWLYLTSEVVIFAMLIAGYVIFRATQANAVNIVKESLGILLVSGNTFVLLASSYAMVMGLRSIEMGKRQGFYFWIGLTAVLGLAFLGGQYIEYSELGHLQITLAKHDFTVETTVFENVNEVEGVVTATITDANGEVLGASSEYVNLREFEVPTDALVTENAEGTSSSVAITAYHVDFVDNAKIFENIDLTNSSIGYSDSFILLDEAGAVISDARAIDDELIILNGNPRDTNVPLSRLAVESSTGEIVPFAAIVAGQAIELIPAQYASLNAYFGKLLGNNTSLFGMRFYAPTAFHGAHVFIGVLWALLILWRGYRGRYDHNAIAVEMFGLYWHFVDVVWIVLFTLIYLV
jgi:heme/copper-type cytochrome/quinol oxidase subunit 3